jgi:hypothetical protein
VWESLRFLEGDVEGEVVPDRVLPAILVLHAAVKEVLLADGIVNGLEAKPTTILSERVNNQLGICQRGLVARVFAIIVRIIVRV